MFKTLKTKIDNLKSNFLNLKYIKKSIKFYNSLKDLAIKYKLISPKKQESISDKFDKYLKSTEIKLKKEIEKKKFHSLILFLYRLWYSIFMKFFKVNYNAIFFHFLIFVLKVPKGATVFT